MRRTNAQAVIIAAALLLGITFAPTADKAHAQDPLQSDEVLKAADKVAPTVQEVAQKLWDLSEVSLLETKSSAYLKHVLKTNGFTITSAGTAGVPTAFIAEYGKGEPKLGILLEYDALPGLGNEPVPKKQPRKDGIGAVVGTAGATGVWADENTRPGIFDAMKRKETFGTSGPQIRLRFFGGWGYPSDLVDDADWVKKAYQGGVPMGGDLPDATTKAPTFAVWALKDPESGNLDRIQIIKAFVNKWNRPGEKIYDVAWSDNRKHDPATGKLPPVGNTVDVKTATYTNDIGSTQLSAVWTDPDFDPSQRAVYYVRTLEIPTPRWSTHDAVKLGVAPPSLVPATLQERAWSSPIWYTPPTAAKVATK